MREGKHSLPASSTEKYVLPAARGRASSAAQGVSPFIRLHMSHASENTPQV